MSDKRNHETRVLVEQKLAAVADAAKWREADKQLARGLINYALVLFGHASAHLDDKPTSPMHGAK